MLVDSSSLEAHTNYMAHTQNKEEWLATVAELGGVVEPDGSGLIVAHIDGEHIGYWDESYAGVGMGVIYETESLQLQWD
jgi:hypothetical protein